MRFRYAALAALAFVVGLGFGGAAEAACPGITTQANLYANNRGYAVGGWVGCDAGGTIAPAFVPVGQNAAPLGVTGNPFAVASEGNFKATYSFAALGIVPAAAATDVVTIKGSSSKAVRLTQISVCGTATAASTIDVLLLERSTANSAGTSSAPTIVPLDASDAAASATALTYTANPTLGTSAGNIRARKLNLGATSGGAGCLIFDFSTRNAKGPVLRDAAHLVAVNLNAASIPSGTSLDIDAEWTEE